MYGRLGLEYMMMYSFGTSSLSAMLISLKSRKQKWLWTDVSVTLCWLNSPGRSAAGLVVQLDVPLGLSRGALNAKLVHGLGSSFEFGLRWLF